VASSEYVCFGELDYFITASAKHGPRHVKRETADLLERDFWRQREFLSIHDHFYQCWTIVRECFC
jgi:hypothetical protein